MAISMLKIRRLLGRLIFNMGIAIPGKTVFLIETAHCFYVLFITIVEMLTLCTNKVTPPPAIDQGDVLSNL